MLTHALNMFPNGIHVHSTLFSESPDPDRAFSSVLPCRKPAAVLTLITLRRQHVEGAAKLQAAAGSTADSNERKGKAWTDLTIISYPRAVSAGHSRCENLGSPNDVGTRSARLVTNRP